MIEIVNTAEIDVLWVLHDIWERRWEEGVLPIRGSLPKQASIKHVNSNNLLHII